MINLNYQMDHIQYQIFKIILDTFDKPSVQIYANKIENRITFKIENGYSLKLLTSETMKLLGITENKMESLKIKRTKTVKMCIILKLMK